MNAIIAFALKFRARMVALYALVMVGGLVAFFQPNIEAYPDPVPPLVDIVTQNPGQSAEEIERYITIPIEIGVTTAPFLTSMRAISLFGLADVKLQFTYGLTYEEAEQKVLNRLSQLPALQNQAQPTISPWSPIGEIYRYQLVGPSGYSVMDLKTLQDWVVARRFRAVPGVIDVTAWGGKTKSFELQIDRQKLVAFGLTLPQVLQVLNNSNINVGGNTFNIGQQSAIVRGVGLIRSIDDIRNTMLTAANGTPVFVSDVAEVLVGNKPRLGIAGRDAENDIVQGIVLMRRGQQSLPTIQRVKAEVQKINALGILPPGVRIERIYDRGNLINLTTHTVLFNLIFGMILVFFVQWIFLGDLRSAIIVSSTIPFALFFAIGILVLRGKSANLLSVGAIDFGLIVDATVIMVENIFRHLAEGIPHNGNAETPVPAGIRGNLATIFRAAAEVNRAIFFSATIIIAGFIPLFTLRGVEGHIFGPMAKTYAYALAGALLATFTVVPALSAYLLHERVRETETLVVRALRRLYNPVVTFAVAHRVLALGTAGLLLACALISVRFLGLKFLPHLEEGNLWIRATMPPSISLEDGNDFVNRMRLAIKEFPEVETVVSQQGRPDDGTDATGFFNAEFFVPLKPAKEWRNAMNKDKLIEEINGALGKFPGVNFNFSQYIQDNVEEAVSGVKGENSVKLIGNDVFVLTATAEKIKNAMSKVRGVTDLAVFTSLGQPTLGIDIDRKAAARYGLAPGDINAAIQTAVGGQTAGELYEQGSDRHFPMVIRLAPQYRQSLDAITSLTIAVQDPATNKVAQIPLREVAKINLMTGPAFIYREQQQRYIPVKFSVRGRDLGSTVLHWNHCDSKESVCQGREVDVEQYAAMIGGIFALVVTGTPFSVSAAIGFIALFGIAVMCP